MSRSGRPSREHAGLGVEGEGAADDARRGMTGRAPHQGAQPHDQLLDPERLGEIVVGTGLEAVDLVAPAAARREDQHRKPAAGLPPGAQYGRARHLGQAEIEHGGVVGLGLAEMLAVLAVRGDVDGEALVAQRLGDLARQRTVVFDQQNLHGLDRVANARIGNGPNLNAC